MIERFEFKYVRFVFFAHEIVEVIVANLRLQNFN